MTRVSIHADSNIVNRPPVSGFLQEDIVVESQDSAQPAVAIAISTEYDLCCQQLRSVLDKDCEVGFLCICSAISLLCTRLRPLSKAETLAAVRLNKGICMGEESDHFCLSLGNSVIIENDDGVIEFANPAMRDFLQVFHIRGIDPSHRTIAKICEVQKDLNAKPLGPLPVVDLSAHAGSAFSDYAAEYWQEHHKLAYV